MKMNILKYFITIFLVLSITNILSGNEENYYLDVLLFGTDSDIINAFSNCNKDLGKDVNNQILKIFQENHRLEVYNTLINYIRVVKLDAAKDLLIKELERKKANDDYLENVIYTIGALKVKKSFNKLINLAVDRNKSKRIRIAAIDAIGELSIKSAEDSLISIVKDKKEDTDIKGHAILSLGKIKSTKSKTLIEKILTNRYEKSLLRMYSAYAIKEIEGESSISILSKLINDKDPKVAEYAVNSIAQLKSKKAGDVLIEALRSDYDGVRYYAAKGLGEIKYKKAIKILEYKAKYDSNKRVREESERSLKKIREDETINNDKNKNETNDDNKGKS